jgi:hypothetical protein
MVRNEKKVAGIGYWRPFTQILAPQVGLEPTTLRLTAECSAIELLRNNGTAENNEFRAQQERFL